MSSQKFTNLSSSDEEEVCRFKPKCINRSNSFRLRLEDSDDHDDDSDFAAGPENSPTKSPARKKQRDGPESERSVHVVPLDLSSVSSGACGGPADYISEIISPTPSFPKTSTPVSSSSQSRQMKSITEKKLEKLAVDSENLQKAVDLQTEKLNECLLILKRLELHQTPKRGTKHATISVPAHIKQAVRDGYKHNKTENSLAWSTKSTAGVILKCTSEENKPMSEAICLYVKGQYPSTEEGVIKSGIETYFTTIKQRKQMEESGKQECHNRKMVLYGRKNRKLQNRIKALRGKKLSPTEEEKIMRGLKIEFMSSEDSDSEDETVLTTRPIPWLSTEYKEVIQKLDSKYQRQLNAQGKKLRSKRIIGRPSQRPCPKKPEDLSWVFA